MIKGRQQFPEPYKKKRISSAIYKDRKKRKREERNILNFF